MIVRIIRSALLFVRGAFRHSVLGLVGKNCGEQLPGKITLAP